MKARWWVLFGLLSAALTTALLAIAGTIWRNAKSLVTPPTIEEYPVTVHSIDRQRKEITLSKHSTVTRPGQFDLWWPDERSSVRVGQVLRIDESVVVRELLDGQLGTPVAPASVRELGWWFAGPEHVGVPYRDVTIDTKYGPAPAWLFTPVESRSGDWVIHVHGRTANRHETLRAVAVVSRLGWQSLSISVRNDGVGPTSPGGTYELGVGEAEDVAVAIDWARQHGAKRIVLFGWSMGGAASIHVDRQVDGLILESPALSWDNILDYQARLVNAPAWASKLMRALLASPVGARSVGADRPIRWQAADGSAALLARLEPALLLVSTADQTVPAGPALQIAQRKIPGIHVEVFSTAGHCRLWNVEPARWEQTVTDWLSRFDESGS